MERDSLQQYFPKQQDVPLTEVMATVNQYSDFLGELQHWQQVNVKKKVPRRSLLAAIMGLGCGIGARKMGRISSQVTEDDLEHAVNWYLPLDNIRAANDRVVGYMNQLQLPNTYRRSKIEDNWDDFLRLITSIKLKEVTASDIFRRLNSYSKQHALYKAMKAFGRIIKSLFILRYLDELELRQAIEMQLNKVELANRFTRAVAVGNPRGKMRKPKRYSWQQSTRTPLFRGVI